jgi:hypothetical protein
MAASTRRCSSAAWKIAPALWPTRWTLMVWSGCCLMYSASRRTVSDAPGMAAIAVWADEEALCVNLR